MYYIINSQQSENSWNILENVDCVYLFLSKEVKCKLWFDSNKLDLTNFLTDQHNAEWLRGAIWALSGAI